MEKFSEEFLTEVLKFYKSIGLKKTDFFKDDNILGMYEILGIRPEYDANGKRKLTPYEILGVPPIIVNGREIPIVFAIKNKTKKVKRIGKVDGPVVDFVYKNKKVQEKDSLLEQLKKKYKEALIAGDEELAAQFLQMIDELTGGRSVEFLHSFYDYTKFYRRMKKQLLIDLFNHFFLMFMMENSLTIKKGIIKKGKVYKAFRDDETQREKQEEIADFQMGQRLLGGKGGPKISKISVSRGDEDLPMSKSQPKSKEPVPVSQKKPEPEREEREDEWGRCSRLNKRRRFGRVRKYEPFEDALDSTIFVPPPVFPPIFEEVPAEPQTPEKFEGIFESFGQKFDPESLKEFNQFNGENRVLDNFVKTSEEIAQGQEVSPEATKEEESKQKVEEMQRGVGYQP